MGRCVWAGLLEQGTRLARDIEMKGRFPMETVSVVECRVEWEKI